MKNPFRRLIKNAKAFPSLDTTPQTIPPITIDVIDGIPPITITRRALDDIFRSIASQEPETGGILLGPVGSDEVTVFHFDASAKCSSGTYSPDTVTLARKMKEEWLPSGLDLKGFCHSHPGTFDRLSSGDITYIGRLLEINPDMNVFVAPIVIPFQFRIRPIIVLRSQPDRPYFTTLRIV